MIKTYNLGPQALVLAHGSSKGTQQKYYDNGYWYKVNQLGYEGKSEYLVSRLLFHSNISDYVEYEECRINDRPGCRSKNFLSPNESFVSFQRVYELYTGGNLTDRIRLIPEVSARIDFVVTFIMDRIGLNCRQYLSEILSLDMLILNTDRHFNNLGIIADTADSYYGTAPVFDNGCSLLSDWMRFDRYNSLEENLGNVYGQPFSANLEVQADAAGIGLKLNYQALYEELDAMEDQSRALEVLKYQLERYRNIIPDIAD